VGPDGHGSDLPPARRFRGLTWTVAAGRRVPVAARPLTRLLGLALLQPACAGPGLLIPRCRSVHTLGMRFPLDVVFLDRRGAVISCRRGVRPGRLVFERRAKSVLELPA
jgi:uncharacterized protein